MKTLLTICAMMVIIGMSTSLQAVMVDFEDGGYTLAADGSATIALSTEQSHSSSHSVKIQLSDATPGSDFGKINVPYSGLLSQTTATCWDYVPSTNDRPELAPYLYFIVDNNKNGTYDYPNDGLVIAFLSGAVANPTDTWFQASLDGTTMVHVVGDRTGLAAGTFSASGTQDTLDNLRATAFSGTETWGDQNVILVRAGAGEWPGASNYTAYVDDITVVPEPATMVLLGLGGLLLRKRK